MKNLCKTILACMTILLISLTATNAAIIHISKSGNDSNNGQSWGTAKLTVQAGINAASSGDEVWVAEGTYGEHISHKSGVGLYGGFDGGESSRDDRDYDNNVTTLSGGSHTDTGVGGGCVITVPAGANNNTVIDGFTITEGHGTYGGGILCSWASPVIKNNIITTNSSTYRGGGIYCSKDVNSSYFALIENNTIEDNTSHDGGGIFCLGTSSEIRNNTVTNNTCIARGGGITLDYNVVGATTYPSLDKVECNTITGNSVGLGGGGIEIGWYCSPTLTDNIVSGNTSAGGGGGIVCDYLSTPVIRNNTVNSNSSTNNGGGIYCYQSSATISNNTVCDNTSGTAGAGGGICLSGSSTPTVSNNVIVNNTGPYAGGLECYMCVPTITNNTISGNTNAGIHCNNSPGTISNNIIVFNAYAFSIYQCTVTRYNNCIYGNTSGNTTVTSEISADPLFVDRTNEDYHIQSGSPCIDVGLDSAVGTEDLDIDGQERINGTHVDIGADELYKVATPSFSPDGGTYNSAQSVTITCSTDGAAIRYTIDGTEPTEASTAYTSPVTVDHTLTLKAKAFKDLWAPSDVKSADYLIDLTPPVPGTADSPQYASTSPITVTYSGASDSGSGLKKVELWYKKNSGGTWSNTNLTPEIGISGSFSFIPSPANEPAVYYFDLVAEDNAGNRSANPSGDGDCHTIYEAGLGLCQLSGIFN